MIAGLQALVPGTDVLKFARERVAYHKDKATMYQAQKDALAAAGVQVEAVSGDAKQAVINKVAEHRQAAEELEFMCDYIKADEQYLLSRHDLQQLGKVTRGW